MRILFLHEVNYLKKPIFEMHEFPEYLAERGHEVGFVQFPEGEPKESVSKIPWKQKMQGRVVKDSQITLYTPKTKTTSTFGRVRAALTFSKAFANILKDFKPDLVVSFSVPTSGWQALRTCKKANIPYLFRALDVSHKIRKSAFSLLILAAEKYIYSNADWVSVNNPAMLEYCQSHGGSSKASVNFPPVDFQLFESAKHSRAQMRSALGIPQEANVAVYMGSFFYFSGLPGVIREFAKDIDDNSYLLLVGAGEQDSELRHIVSSLGLQRRVIFTGMVPYTELPSYIGLADVAINPMLKSLVSDSALPNKVLQYLACGVPVISTPLNGLKSIFNGFSGVTFSSEPASLGSEIREAFKRKAWSSGSDGIDSETLQRIFATQQTVDAFESIIIAMKPEGLIG